MDREQAGIGLLTGFEFAYKLRQDAQTCPPSGFVCASVGIAQEHEALRQLTNDYPRELQFAILLRTNETVRLGTALFEQLGPHIAHQASLLTQIEEGSAAEERLLLRYTHPGE